MTPDEQRRCLAALEKMRLELIENARQAVRGSVRFDPDDAADEIDSAAAETGVGFVGRLRDRERTLLVKVEGAIRQIDSIDQRLMRIRA